MSVRDTLSEFLGRFGCKEGLMAVFYTDKEPVGGYSPDPGELLTDLTGRRKFSWLYHSPAFSQYRFLS